MQKDAKSEVTDEIDLGELLLKFVRLLNKNKIVFIVTLAIGAVSGYVFYSQKPTVYESSMMLQSDILTEAYSEALTENLHKLIAEGNYAILSQKLVISKEEASHIQDIQVESVTNASTGIAGGPNIFLVTVEITNNTVLPSLQNGLINFLKNNEFVKKRVELKRDRYSALIRQMKKEAKELDSLKGLVNERITKGGQGKDLLVLDPSNVYEQALKNYKEKLTYEENLELIDSIQLIEGFTPFNRPVSPNLFSSLIGGLLAGLLIAFFIVFFREMRSYLKSIDQ